MEGRGTEGREGCFRAGSQGGLGAEEEERRKDPASCISCSIFPAPFTECLLQRIRVSPSLGGLTVVKLGQLEQLCRSSLCAASSFHAVLLERLPPADRRCRNSPGGPAGALSAGGFPSNSPGAVPPHLAAPRLAAAATLRPPCPPVRQAHQPHDVEQGAQPLPAKRGVNSPTSGSWEAEEAARPRGGGEGFDLARCPPPEPPPPQSLTVGQYSDVVLTRYLEHAFSPQDPQENLAVAAEEVYGERHCPPGWPACLPALRAPWHCCPPSMPACLPASLSAALAAAPVNC